MIRNMGPPRCYLLPAHTQQEGTQDPRQKGGPAGGPGGRGCAPGALRDQERLVRPGSPSCHPDPGRADTLGREWGQALALPPPGPARPGRGSPTFKCCYQHPGAQPSQAHLRATGTVQPLAQPGGVVRGPGSRLFKPGTNKGGERRGLLGRQPGRGWRGRCGAVFPGTGQAGPRGPAGCGLSGRCCPVLCRPC